MGKRAQKAATPVVMHTAKSDPNAVQDILAKAKLASIAAQGHAKTAASMPKKASSSSLPPPSEDVPPSDSNTADSSPPKLATPKAVSPPKLATASPPKAVSPPKHASPPPKAAGPPKHASPPPKADSPPEHASPPPKADSRPKRASPPKADSPPKHASPPPKADSPPKHASPPPKADSLPKAVSPPKPTPPKAALVTSQLNKQEGSQEPSCPNPPTSVARPLKSRVCPRDPEEPTASPDKKKPRPTPPPTTPSEDGSGSATSAQLCKRTLSFTSDDSWDAGLPRSKMGGYSQRWWWGPDHMWSDSRDDGWCDYGYGWGPRWSSSWDESYYARRQSRSWSFQGSEAGDYDQSHADEVAQDLLERMPTNVQDDSCMATEQEHRPADAQETNDAAADEQEGTPAAEQTGNAEQTVNAEKTGNAETGNAEQTGNAERTGDPEGSPPCAQPRALANRANDADAWRKNKQGEFLNPPALYIRFYRSVRSSLPVLSVQCSCLLDAAPCCQTACVHT